MANVENPYETNLSNNLVVTSYVDDKVQEDYDYVAKILFLTRGTPLTEDMFDSDSAYTVPFSVPTDNIDYKAAFISINDYTAEELEKYNGQQFNFSSVDFENQYMQIQIRKKDGTVIDHSNISCTGATSDIFNLKENYDYAKSEFLKYFNSIISSAIDQLSPALSLFMQFLVLALVLNVYKCIPKIVYYSTGTVIEDDFDFLFTLNGYDFYASEYYSVGYTVDDNSSISTNILNMADFLQSIDALNSLIDSRNYYPVRDNSKEFFDHFVLSYQTLNDTDYYLDSGVEGIDINYYTYDNYLADLSIGSNVTISLNILEGNVYFVIEHVRRKIWS